MMKQNHISELLYLFNTSTSQRRNCNVVLVCAALLPSMASAQSAAEYPAKPVRVVVPSAIGGSVDIVPRLVAAKLSDTLKRQFVIENRPGGGGTIGNGYVAKSAPDGYTLLATGATFTIAPALYPNVPYDAIKGFVPVSQVSRSPLVLAAHPALPAKTVKDLIAIARQKPGALDMGVGFSGSFTHLAAAYFASAANIKVTYIPFKGSGDVVIATVAGQVQVFIGNVLAVLPSVKSGRLRALAVTSVQRSKVLPDLPTIAEAGVHGYDVSAWTGWLAPAGT